MKKNSIFSIALVVLAAPLISKAQGYQKTASGVKASVNDATIEVQFFSPEIVRVTKWPIGKNFTKESLSVIKKPAAVPVTLKQQSDLLNLRSSKLNVTLNLKTGELAFASLSGQSLLKEKRRSEAFVPFDD